MPEESLVTGEDPAQSDDDQYILRFDRRQNLYEQLGKHRDDPEFSQAAATIYGGKRTRALADENAQLRSALNQYASVMAQAEAREMPPEAFKQRWQQDPGFRARQMASTQSQQVDPTSRAAMQAITEAYDEAIEAGMPVEWRDEIDKFRARGDFDRDREGRPLDTVRAVRHFQKYMDDITTKRPWEQKQTEPDEEEPAPRATTPVARVENPRLRDNADNRPTGNASRTRRGFANQREAEAAHVAGLITNEQMRRARVELPY